MFGKVVADFLITSVLEGGRRTISGKGNGVVDNTIDVIFEKGDIAIDNFFDPLIKIGGKIDDIFGW